MSRAHGASAYRGVIAEFVRSDEESVGDDDLHRLEIVTPRGAIRISPPEQVRQIRYRNSVQFCLPTLSATLPRCNHVLTEIGADTQSVSGEFRQHILFDLGLHVPHLRACIRTADVALLATLREHTGRALLAADGELLRLLAANSPHRVFMSTLARIEVYGPIPTEHTPNAPHTHLLPALLGTTDAALERLMAPGEIICLSLYLADQ